MAVTTPAQQYLKEQLLALEPETEWGGDYANKPGYHSTRKDNQRSWPDNYSIQDAEDLGGPSDKTAAYDWTFPDAQAGRYDLIMKYCKRLLASGQDPNDTRLDGWREFYGQADKDTHVEGWDFRYVVSVTSDSSHLWHIHLSENRDQVESYENKDKLLEVLRGDDVALTPDDIKKIWSYKVASPALGLEPTDAQFLLLSGKTAELKLSNISAPTGILEENTVHYLLGVTLERLSDLADQVQTLSDKIDHITIGDVNPAVADALRLGADAIDPES